MEKTIFDHLRERGMTVAGVCREAGISRPTFYSAFKPGANPKLSTVKALAQVLDLQMSDISA